MNNDDYPEIGDSYEFTPELMGEKVTNTVGAYGAKILVVDDITNMRLLLSQYLESLGYDEILTASSANEAFKYLVEDPAVPGSGGVELILMDINMPGIGGIEACRRIKGEKGFRDIHIIMVTSETDPEKLRQAFDAGAMDYITKPFNRIELRVRVESAFKLKASMDAQKLVNALLEEKNQAMEEAMEKVKRLRGLLPICASCKDIRDDSGTWNVLEQFITEHFETKFNHCICPECHEELYPEIHRQLQESGELTRD